MRKIHVLSFALVAACVLNAVVTSAAFAEELPAEFLSGGAVITTFPLAFHIENKGTELLLLEDMKALGGAVDVLCSGLFDGLILSAKDADIETVLSLTGTTPIPCEIMTFGGCLNNGQEALIGAINLPWLVEPVLLNGLFVLLILENGAGLPGYVVECETIIGKFTDTCTANTGAEAKNIAEGIEAGFSETSEEITPSGNCTSGAALQALLFGFGIITDPEGGVLSVSS